MQNALQGDLITGEWTSPRVTSPQEPREREPGRHRVVHISEVRLRPEQLQIWPASASGLDAQERTLLFGDLPARPKLFVWEVAHHLCCSSDLVYDMIDDGTLDAINVARRDAGRPDYRVMRYSLVDLVLKRREGAA
jgi:hypothetical protein